MSTPHSNHAGKKSPHTERMCPMTTITAYLTTKDAARHLGFSYKTLESWRARGMGPRYRQLPNGRIRYLMNELDDWARSLGDTSTKH